MNKYIFLTPFLFCFWSLSSLAYICPGVPDGAWEYDDLLESSVETQKLYTSLEACEDAGSDNYDIKDMTHSFYSEHICEFKMRDKEQKEVAKLRSRKRDFFWFFNWVQLNEAFGGDMPFHGVFRLSLIHI